MKANPVSWIILIALSLVWGSSFILMKKGMIAFSSDEVAALRIAIAFLFLIPFYVKHNQFHFKKNWKGLVLMGVFGNLIPAFLFTAAETQINSSLAGMLNALTPLFTILIAWWWFKSKFSSWQVYGVLLGMLGALALLQINSNETSWDIHFGYSLLVVAATLCYAISINGIKQYLSQVPSITATVGAFTITGPFAIGYLFVQTDFMEDIKHNDLAINSLLSTSILAIVGSALSVIVYNKLIKDAGVVFAAMCTYLIPIVAVFWGVLDGESINLWQVFGIILVILSIYLINRAQSFGEKQK